MTRRTPTLCIFALTALGTGHAAAQQASMELISKDPNGQFANGGSDRPDVSDGARYVAFQSSATNLGTPIAPRRGLTWACSIPSRAMWRAPSRAT